MENREEFEKMSMKMGWTKNPDKIIVVNTILEKKSISTSKKCS